VWRFTSLQVGNASRLAISSNQELRCPSSHGNKDVWSLVNGHQTRKECGFVKASIPALVDLNSQNQNI